MRAAHAAVLAVALGLGGCQRASEEQRAEAVREGRNLRGPSPHSRDDRIAKFVGQELGPQPGHLEGAFAHASVTVRGLHELARMLALPSEWAELLAGLDPATRISVSARQLGVGVHLRAYVPEPSREWVERVRASGVSVRADGSAQVIDLFEPKQSALIDEALAVPSTWGPAELASSSGDAVVLLDGPGAAAAFGVDPRLRAVERLFAGLKVEVQITEERLLARVRWLPSEAGRARLREVFELDPVDAAVPTIASLCAGALICARSRGLPSRQRFAALATGLYADRDALSNMLDEPATALVLLLETWPNAIASFMQVPHDLRWQNAAEIGGRVLGFGASLRAEQAGADWLVYARMSGADLDAVRLLFDVSGYRLPAANFYSAFDPGRAWGFAIAAAGEDPLAWFSGLPHDDGAVPLAYVELPELARLHQARPDLLPFTPPAGGLRAQLTLADDWSPELRLQLER